MRPANGAWTRPPAFGSMAVRPFSSIATAWSPNSTLMVRMAIRRCASFGTLTLPSGSRARPPALVAPATSRCSPFGPCAPGDAMADSPKASQTASQDMISVVFIFVLVSSGRGGDAGVAHQSVATLRQRKSSTPSAAWLDGRDRQPRGRSAFLRADRFRRL